MICINQQFHFTVEAFVREEINTMDHSELFLDIFINDDFTQYGGFNDLVLPGDNSDATDTDNTWHQGSSSVVQPLPPHAMIVKSRFVRSVIFMDTCHMLILWYEGQQMSQEQRNFWKNWMNLPKRAKTKDLMLKSLLNY